MIDDINLIAKENFNSYQEDNLPVSSSMDNILSTLIENSISSMLPNNPISANLYSKQLQIGNFNPKNVFPNVGVDPYQESISLESESNLNGDPIPSNTESPNELSNLVTEVATQASSEGVNKESESDDTIEDIPDYMEDRAGYWEFFDKYIKWDTSDNFMNSKLIGEYTHPSYLENVRGRVIAADNPWTGKQEIRFYDREGHSYSVMRNPNNQAHGWNVTTTHTPMGKPYGDTFYDLNWTQKESSRADWETWDDLIYLIGTAGISGLATAPRYLLNLYRAGWTFETAAYDLPKLLADKNILQAFIPSLEDPLEDAELKKTMYEQHIAENLPKFKEKYGVNEGETFGLGVPMEGDEITFGDIEPTGLYDMYQTHFAPKE